MKGCLIINKKNRRLVTIAVLLVLLLAFVGMAVVALIAPLRYSNNDQHNEFTFPAVVGNGSDGFVANTRISASIPAMTGIELISGTLEQDVQLYNPDENPCVFVVSLYLGDGTLLFQTDPIYPGCTTEAVTLTRVLEEGRYKNAMLIYDCYSADGNMTPLTRCELIIEINSK